MNNKVIFLFGLSVGISFTIITTVYNNVQGLYKYQFAEVTNFKSPIADGSNVIGREKVNQTLDQLQGDNALAQELYRKVRVACWIMTSPSNLDRKTIYVKNTWAQRCHLVLYMSSEKNDTFPTIGLNATEGRNHLTAKSVQAFQYLYENHLEDAEWFMKADDDTYVIMENLRYMLSSEDPNEPIYFGQKLRQGVKQGYASGGAGYVWSKEALRRFGQRGSNHTASCKMDTGHEDMEMGRCLESLGVKLKSSLDSLNRLRFHCYSPETYLRKSFPDGFIHNVDGEFGRAGQENISNYAISFHYVSGFKMYDLEFYIYHLRPYGILNVPLELNIKN